MQISPQYSQSSWRQAPQGVVKISAFVTIAISRNSCEPSLRAFHNATRSAQVLKPSGYLVLFVKDLQPTPIHHGLLHADIVVRLAALPDLAYRGCKIWYDQTPRLYPFGYP